MINYLSVQILHSSIEKLGKYHFLAKNVCKYNSLRFAPIVTKRKHKKYTSNQSIRKSSSAEIQIIILSNGEIGCSDNIMYWNFARWKCHAAKFNATKISRGGNFLRWNFRQGNLTWRETLYIVIFRRHLLNTKF